MRFKVGDHVVWNKPYSSVSRISKIVCRVVKSNPCSYRLEYLDPLKGRQERTAGLHNVVPFTGDWETERKNEKMVRYGSLLATG